MRNRGIEMKEKGSSEGYVSTHEIFVLFNV
jgi:hypothetical protein